MRSNLYFPLRAVGAVLLLIVTAAAEEIAATPERWERVIELFEEQDKHSPPKPDSVLFTGSSSIRLWDTASAFPQHEVINRGFGGSTFPDLLYYTDRIVTPYAPRSIFVYEGDNDLAQGHTPEQVRDNFLAWVGIVRDSLPEAPIHFLSIKPSPARWSLEKAMVATNKMIEAVCEQDATLHYVDVYSCLLDDTGKPDAALFMKDNLHLNSAGYARWQAIVAPLLPEGALSQSHQD